MKKSILCIFVPLLLILALLTSCSSGKSALVGKWVTEDGYLAPSGLPDDMDLIKDGTGIVEGYGVTWKTDGRRLIINVNIGIASAWDYSISGSRLILTADDGRSETYIKER